MLLWFFIKLTDKILVFATPSAMPTVSASDATVTFPLPKLFPKPFHPFLVLWLGVGGAHGGGSHKKLDVQGEKQLVF